MDYQGISFPLADSATDAALGRLLALQVCAMVDAGADPKLIHAKASMAKLFVSEAAGRCADRAVQAFGGRGYMRTQRRRAVQPRAPRRPDLGGHQRDPAADHRPRARAPRRRGDDPLTAVRTEATGADLRRLHASGLDRRRRGDRPAGQLRRPGAAQPRDDRLPGRGVGRQPAPRPRCWAARACRPSPSCRSRSSARGRGDPGGRRARGDRAGRRSRLWRRGRDQRRLRRGAGGRATFSARWSRRRRATDCRCAVPTATGSCRRATGSRCGATPCRRREPGPVALDLPERQRRRQRARDAAAGCAFTR